MFSVGKSEDSREFIPIFFIISQLKFLWLIKPPGAQRPPCSLHIRHLISEQCWNQTLIQPVKIRRLLKSGTADRCTRLGTIPKCFVKEVIPKVHDLTNKISVIGNIKHFTKGFNPVRMALSLNVIPTLCYFPAAVEHHVFNRKSLPVPFIRRYPWVHVEHVGDQLLFSFSPALPSLVAVR